MELAGRAETVSLRPGEPVTVTVPLGPVSGEALQDVGFQLTVGGATQAANWSLRTVSEIGELLRMPTEYEMRMELARAGRNR
ncbi:MAG: hypothetical protein M5U09_28200 [Gammaproteobacteria bacterium]|nr:hypothetical protein [Gammaproteobacteria bacterium]